MALYCQWMLQIAVELGRARPGLRGHGAEVRRALRLDRDRARPARRRHARCGTRRTASSTTCCGCPTATTIPLKVRSLVGLLPLCAATVFDAERARRASPGSSSASLQFVEHFADAVPGARPPARPEPRGPAPARARRRDAAAADPRGRCSTRTSSSARTASARSRAATSSTRTCSTGTASTTRSTTCRPSRTPGMFGGNSNWRGPVWFPMNLVILRGAAAAAPLLRRRLQGRVPDRLRAAR